MITFRFSTSAPGYKKGQLCGVATLSGSGKRAALPITWLVNPNFKSWNQESQRFEEPTEEAIRNNLLLEGFRKKCLDILGKYDVREPKELFDIIHNGTGRGKIKTFGDFVEAVIEERRTTNRNKKLSWTYKNFINLHNKLKKEGRIINTRIEEVSNIHFVAFSDFILSLPDRAGRSNYKNLMVMFKTIHNMAYERELNNNILRFKYSNYIPMKADCAKRPALTMEEYNRFKELDANAPAFKRNKNSQLYKDFCIFLYESKSRPIDVLKTRHEQIIDINGTPHYVYTPEKKKNSSKKNAHVETPLSQVAVEIIEKYKNRSVNGYVFPFAIHQRKLDKRNYEDFDEWMQKELHTIASINYWLRQVRQELRIEIPLTTYTFRRTSLTHACASDANYLKIALQAGTSTAMLEEHYVSLSRQ